MSLVKLQAVMIPPTMRRLKNSKFATTKIFRDSEKKPRMTDEKDQSEQPGIGKFWVNVNKNIDLEQRIYPLSNGLNSTSFQYKSVYNKALDMKRSKDVCLSI